MPRAGSSGRLGNVGPRRASGRGKPANGTSGSMRKSRPSQSQIKGGKPFAEAPIYLDYSKRQLIVNFVSQQVTDDEFRDMFAQFGTISAVRIIYDKQSHRSKGYGFVYYSSGEDGAMAIQKMNGFELYGKCIKVGYAVPQRPIDEAAGDESSGTVADHVEGVRVVEDSDSEDDAGDDDEREAEYTI